MCTYENNVATLSIKDATDAVYTSVTPAVTPGALSTYCFDGVLQQDNTFTSWSVPSGSSVNASDVVKLQLSPEQRE